jgi:hypothetical protein
MARLRRLILVTIAVAGLPLALVFAATKLAGSGSAAKARPLATLTVRGETDVSRSGAIESESAVAVDPRNPGTLLAGSNAVDKPWMAVYGSRDGGRSWQHGRLGGPAGTRFCAASDPTVAIDRAGRQYYAFLGLTCRGHRPGSSQISIAVRRNAGAPWRTLRLPVARRARYTLMDDRPYLMVDDGPASPHRGRLYVGWTRFSFDPSVFYADPEADDDVEPVYAVALVSHSDDGGDHWSKPAVLSRVGQPLEVRLATSSDGTLYAVWRDLKTGSIEIARSDDGGHFGSARLVAGAVVDPARSCGKARARIAAQPRRCVSPNPVIAVDQSSGPRAGRVYVTWGSTSLNRSQDVYVAAFDAELAPLLGVGRVQQVNPAEGIRGSDQFLPASTVDQTTGRLWACYYASGRGKAARSARYTCTASDDGGATWLAPRVVASRPSNETLRRANRGNGFGDYEGVAALGGVAHAVWTDGRSLAQAHEEIFSAELR